MPERQQDGGGAGGGEAAWNWPPQSELVSSTMQRDIAMPRLKGLLVDAAGTLLYPAEPVVDVSAAGAAHSSSCVQRAALETLACILIVCPPISWESMGCICP